MRSVEAFLKYVALARFTSLACFAIGWVPILVADFISRRKPFGADRGDLEAFALGWLFFAALFSILGVLQLIVFGVAWAIRFYREWF